MLGRAIYEAICRRTKQAFGQPVWLHLFRAAAATFWSVECPEAVNGTKDLLGHQRFGTTDAHYIHARSIQAARRYSEILEPKIRKHAVQGGAGRTPCRRPKLRAPRLSTL